jgi:hypothetical protein
MKIKKNIKEYAIIYQKYKLKYQKYYQKVTTFLFLKKEENINNIFKLKKNYHSNIFKSKK